MSEKAVITNKTMFQEVTLHMPYQADNDALDFQVLYINRFIFRVGGLEADTFRFAVNAFQRSFAGIQECDDNVAVPGGVATLAYNVIAVADIVLYHAVAADGQHERIAVRRKDLLQVEVFRIFDSLYGRTGCDPPYKGQLGSLFAGENKITGYLQRASAVLFAPQKQTFSFQCADVFEDCHFC